MLVHKGCCVPCFPQLVLLAVKVVFKRNWDMVPPKLKLDAVMFNQNVVPVHEYSISKMCEFDPSTIEDFKQPIPSCFPCGEATHVKKW